MVRVLIRGQSEQQWKLIDLAAFNQEIELQNLLAESPSLISLDEVRAGTSPLLIAVREITLPVGSVDLLGFTAEGDIALIECKLSSNPEIKRKVIGQIMEYAAYLWEMSYQELDEIVLQRSDENLAELVRKAVHSTDWDEEEFRNNVEESLASGNFLLIIVVDEINEDLARVARFINICGSPNFAFAALEMRRFKTEKIEMLLPRVLGPLRMSKRTPVAPPARQWDQSSYFRELERVHGEDAARVARRILEWAQQKMQVRWGKGRVHGSFVPYLDHQGRRHQLFAVYNTFGFVETYFDSFASKPPFDAEEKRLELLSRLNQISDVNIPKDAIKRRPNIKIHALLNEESLEQFLLIYDWVVGEILNS
ncbi:MAG: hypothetical protein IBX69_14490 [Anaerolineales bacterium]|nr:hypothetical protein [Anaerolineales bacterium]